MTDDTAIVREALTWFGTVALSSAHPLISELGEGVLRDAGAALDRLTARLDAERWQPIETAPKNRLIDIIISNDTRWCDCHYDQITDQWRTTHPANRLVWVPARAVTHWRETPALPTPPEADHG